MIGYLQGRIRECGSDGKWLIDLPLGSPEGAAQPVLGYIVTVPGRFEYEKNPPGQWVSLYVYTHVREDALDLYGFLSASEKGLFLTLLGVNGIGPRVAMSILSNIDPQALIRAILEKDKDTLTQIPGIGKKTAERVVLELVDPLQKKVETGLLGDGMRESVVVDRTGVPSPVFSGVGVDGVSRVLKDAKSALLGLGYREQEIQAVLAQVAAEFSNDAMEKTPPGVEAWIKSALKRLI